VTKRSTWLVAQLLAYDAAIGDVAKSLPPEQRIALWEQFCEKRDRSTGGARDALEKIADLFSTIDWPAGPEREERTP
jgi:hypothetical protein